MKNKKGLPPIVRLMYFTTVTVVFWIIFVVYQKITEEPELNIPTYMTIPFSPDLNEKIISEIEKRGGIENIDNFQETEINIKTDEQDKQDEATESAVLEE